jgi:hypothetical protein
MTVTEAKWLGCTDPQPMLTFLRAKAAEQGCLSCTCCRVRCSRQGAVCPTYRKLRLFGCACCHRVLYLLPDPVCQKAERALADYIEGVIDEASYLRITGDFDQTRRRRFPKVAAPEDDAWNALYCAVHRRWLEHFDEHFAEYRWQLAMVIAHDAAASGSEADEKSAQSDLLRDIFGNPFRRVTLSSSVQTWNSSAVVRLAQAADQERQLPTGTLDNTRLAVLADALEEAGCTDSDILSHCRQSGEHVRGCWVVDLILGKW